MLGRRKYANGDPINFVDPRGRNAINPGKGNVTGSPGLFQGLWNEFSDFVGSVATSLENAPGYMSTWQGALSQSSGASAGFAQSAIKDIDGIRKIGNLLENPGSLLGMPPSLTGIVNDWAISQANNVLNWAVSKVSDQAWFDSSAFNNGKPIGQAEELVVSLIAPGGGEAGAAAKGEGILSKLMGSLLGRTAAKDVEQVVVRDVVRETEQIAAKTTAPIVEDTVSLFHQGTLRGGQVSSTSRISTSLSSDLSHYRPNGQLYEFQVPRSTFNQWLDEGSALRFNDMHAPTGIVTPEIRILPPQSGQLNQFLVRPPGG